MFMNFPFSRCFHHLIFIDFPRPHVTSATSATKITHILIPTHTSGGHQIFFCHLNFIFIYFLRALRNVTEMGYWIEGHKWWGGGREWKWSIKNSFFLPLLSLRIMRFFIFTIFLLHGKIFLPQTPPTSASISHFFFFISFIWEPRKVLLKIHSKGDQKSRCFII